MEYYLGLDPGILGAEVLSYLAPEVQQEALNNLILGILQYAQRPASQPERQPHFLKVTDAGQLLLVGVMTPPQKLVMYSHTVPGPAVFAGLAARLKAAGWRIPGVLGQTAVAAAFAAAWAQKSQSRAVQGVLQRTFWLRQVLHRGNAPGALRPACSADLDLLGQWLYGFHCEVWPDTTPKDLVLQRHSVENMIANKALYAWDNQGPVSMAAQTRASARGIAINAVYTPPQQRGKGYATACVAALSQHLLDEGREFCTLFTDLANPTSNHIYQRIGYQALGDFAEWLFIAE